MGGSAVISELWWTVSVPHPTTPDKKWWSIVTASNLSSRRMWIAF